MSKTGVSASDPANVDEVATSQVLPPPEAPLPLVLARLGSVAARLSELEVGSVRLSALEQLVLVELASTPGLGQREVSRRVMVDPRNLVAVLDGLSGHGLITREADPADRRRRIVSLTTTGRAAVAEVETACRRTEHDLLSTVDAAGRESVSSTVDVLRSLLSSTL